MMVLDEEKETLKEITEDFENLVSTLDSGNLTLENEELIKESENLNIYYDLEKLKSVNKRIAYIANKLENYKDVSLKLNELSQLIDLMEHESDESTKNQIASDLEEIKKQINQLASKELLSEKQDICHAIVKISAHSEDGIDAWEFVGTLYQMYLAFSKNMSYEVELLDYKEKEEGYLYIQFLVNGEFAFGHLKGEHGVHKLMRISPHNINNKRSSAKVYVEVTPYLESDEEITLDENHLKIDTFKSSGAGGQHVNTTSSAVRITHLPTGLVVTCQNERSQFQNLKQAKKVLINRLIEMEKKSNQVEENSLESAKQIAVRNYLFHPKKQVIDKRTNCKTNDIEGVLEGDLLNFIYAYLRWLQK